MVCAHGRLGTDIVKQGECCIGTINEAALDGTEEITGKTTKTIISVILVVKKHFYMLPHEISM